MERGRCRLVRGRPLPLDVLQWQAYHLPGFQGLQFLVRCRPLGVMLLLSHFFFLRPSCDLFPALLLVALKAFELLPSPWLFVLSLERALLLPSLSVPLSYFFLKLFV